MWSRFFGSVARFAVVLSTLLLVDGSVQAATQGVPYLKRGSALSSQAVGEGGISVEQYQLYPENLEFDFGRGLLYFGSLFNASVAVYNPFEKRTVDIITFSDITYNPEFHLGGIGVDPTTGYLTIVVDDPAPFYTSGGDLSGTNWLLQYDFASRTVLTRINLTETTQGRSSGYQDVEHDEQGNIYVVGTYPSTILRVESGPDGEKAVVPWYLSSNPATRAGFSGLASVRDKNLLLSVDSTSGDVVRFDTRDAKGTPFIVPRTPDSPVTSTDAIYLPPRYNGAVLLVARPAVGIAVLRSRDRSWEAAEYLGVVPLPTDASTDPLLAGGSVTAPIQIGDKLFMNLEFFADPIITPWGAGNRTVFPLVDITKQVEVLLNTYT